MSYDLFLIRTSPSLRRQDFEAYFQNRPHYTLNENKTQAWYENDTTGVYFSFDFEKDGYFTESERELEEESDTSSGIFNKLKLLFKGQKTGAPHILFNINYNRPSIFICTRSSYRVSPNNPRP